MGGAEGVGTESSQLPRGARLTCELLASGLTDRMLLLPNIRQNMTNSICFMNPYNILFYEWQ
ncbi:MAG: hypothetical protein H6845_00600 [Alphaproteobacteria bacterium]|nr:MAG: hypothetical protein H6845_00600 [Alphaproteobacteria bacterium]